MQRLLQHFTSRLAESLLLKERRKRFGVRGRPHILTKEQEDQFMGFLTEKYEGNYFHICDARAEVRKTIPIWTSLCSSDFTEDVLVLDNWKWWISHLKHPKMFSPWHSGHDQEAWLKSPYTQTCWSSTSTIDQISLSYSISNNFRKESSTEDRSPSSNNTLKMLT